MKITKLIIKKKAKAPHVMEVWYEGTEDGGRLGLCKAMGIHTEFHKVKGGWVRMEPFRRQPVEILLDDQAVTDWLMKQGCPVETEEEGKGKMKALKLV